MPQDAVVVALAVVVAAAVVPAAAGLVLVVLDPQLGTFAAWSQV